MGCSHRLQSGDGRCGRPLQRDRGTPIWRSKYLVVICSGIVFGIFILMGGWCGVVMERTFGIRFCRTHCPPSTLVTAFVRVRSSKLKRHWSLSLSESIATTCLPTTRTMDCQVLEERFPSFLREFKSAAPDLAVLTEVTPKFLALLWGRELDCPELLLVA